MDEHDRNLNALTDSRTNAPPRLVDLPNPGLDGLRSLRRIWGETPMSPRVVHSRDEGRDNSWPGFDVRTVLVGEESGGRFAFHDVIIAPGAELPPHEVRGGDTYWYVLDGEVELKVGQSTQALGRDGFSFVPENTGQAIRNVSGSPARLYLWTSPAGSERAFAAAHALAVAGPHLSARTYLTALEPFGYHFYREGEAMRAAVPTNRQMPRLEARIDTFHDFMDLRQRWSERAPVPKIVQDRSVCGDIPMAGQDTKVLLSGDEGSGRAVVFNYGIEPGYRAPPHHQPSEEEIFLVIEGELELTAGNVSTILSRGGFGFVPRYGTHGFRNPTDRLTRTVTINSPAGHERGFEMVVRDAGAERFPELLVAHGWRLHEEYTPT